MDLGLGNAEFLVATFVSVFLGWFLYRWTLFNIRSFPPGPIGLPVVGYLRLMLDSPHKVLVELSEKYGKIFSLYFGPAYTVIITDYEIAKEIVSHPASLSRPDDVFGFIPERGGICGFNGAEWQEQRRFCVFAMRNLGMGRGVWENMTKEYAAEFIQEISSWQGKATNIGEHLAVSLAGNNTSLLIGRRLSKKKISEIQLANDCLVLLAKHFNPSCLSVLVPWLPKYMVRFRIGGYHKTNERLNDFANLFRKEIEQHTNSEDAEHSEDFIGSYLTEMKKQNASGKPHYFSANNLVGNLIVLFFAGGDTSISSVHWLILLMAAYPEVQKKVHAEIDDVIGRDGHTSWDDRKSLPYTLAVLLEMERFITINRIFPTRISSSAFECNGYTIPKGSRILVNSWAVMHDPKYWDKPMEFMPERFLRDDVKDPSKMRGLSTFSFGKRNCPGETVAQMSIFIYFTAIMQKFHVKTPSGVKADLAEGPFAIVISPIGQELCFVER